MLFTEYLSDCLENCGCFYWLFGKPKPASRTISNTVPNQNQEDPAPGQRHHTDTQASEQSLLSREDRTHNYNSFARTVCTEQISSEQQPPVESSLWPRLFQFSKQSSKPLDSKEEPLEPERAELEAPAQRSPDSKSCAPVSLAGPSSYGGLRVFPSDASVAPPLPITETVLVQQQQTSAPDSTSAFILGLYSLLNCHTNDYKHDDAV